jgi:hypothetical protein
VACGDGACSIHAAASVGGEHRRRIASGRVREVIIVPRIRFSRATAIGLVAIFSVSLVAPVAVSAETDFGSNTSVIAAIPAAPVTSAEERQVIAAEQALQSSDLGSMQEEALTIIATGGAAPVEAAPLERGTRSESAVLWTILEPEAMPANSDDRIANALFGTSAKGYS